MRRRTRIIGSACLLAVLLAAAGCRRAAPPNVLLITLDTTRADHLGCYGYSRAMTLAIDRLATQGVVFDNAFAAAPLTAPSHATMLTGLYPPEHGVRINGEGTLPSSIPTLAEYFTNRGYRTGAFIGAFVLDRRFGFARGFEVYDDDMRGGVYSDIALYRFRLGQKVADAALQWLRSHAYERFFCWVHLFDPHSPYDPHPDMFGSRFLDKPYDGEIAYVDVQIDRLLRFLDDHRLRNKTLVIIAGDHGEGLDEHRERTHGYLTYNTTLRVPLIFHWPARWKTGRRLAAPVTLADLMPTIIELCGNTPPSVSGRSLCPLLESGAYTDRDLYAETELPLRGHGWAPQYVLLRWPWKYIETARPELFDLASDPGENTNLVMAASNVAVQMAADLAAWQNQWRPRENTVAAALTEKERRALESLGYAVGGERTPAPEFDVPALTDMKDRIEVISMVLDAKTAMSKGDAAEAARLLRAAVEMAPEQFSNREYLAAALHANGETDAAVEDLRALLREAPDRLSAMARLAVILAHSGNLPAAWEIADRMNAVNPASPTTWRTRGELHLLEGRTEEAISALQHVVNERPDHLGARALLARALENAGRLDEARAQRKIIAQSAAPTIAAHADSDDW
jgi:arylsulfatase A-like enzyme/Flp pilus assembly protein TadD